MVSTVLLVVGAAALYAVFTYVNNLRKNIAKVRASGLPYIVVPISPFNRFYQITATIWLPFFKLFPKRLWEDWIL